MAQAMSERTLAACRVNADRLWQRLMALARCGATVIGLDRKQRLKGIKMSSPDIRAGVALLIAALSAQGESEISNIDQIDRGYQNIDTRLKALGADIVRA